MGANPYAIGRQLAQQIIQLTAVAPRVQRIDPDQDAIDVGEIGADRVQPLVREGDDTGLAA